MLVLVEGVEPSRPFELGILSPVRLPFRHTSKNISKKMILQSWRYHPDLNRGIKVLQTFALPLGDGTKLLKSSFLERLNYTILNKLCQLILQNCLSMFNFFSDFCKSS